MEKKRYIDLRVTGTPEECNCKLEFGGTIKDKIAVFAHIFHLFDLQEDESAMIILAAALKEAKEIEAVDNE